jgi:hypothetical protein
MVFLVPKEKLCKKDRGFGVKEDRRVVYIGKSPPPRLRRATKVFKLNGESIYQIKGDC